MFYLTLTFSAFSLSVLQSSTIDTFTYGNYCGQGHGINEILQDPECLTRLFTEDDCIPPIDLLDSICFWHDMCFRHSLQVNGFQNSCDCNKKIMDSTYTYKIPLPIGYNQTNRSVIFDPDTTWDVPYFNDSLFSGSPIKWAQGACQELDRYQTTVNPEDTNIKDVAADSTGACNSAGFVAEQLFPQMKCTCDKKTQMKSKDIPEGGCPAILANPSDPNLSAYSSASLVHSQIITLLFILVN